MRYILITTLCFNILTSIKAQSDTTITFLDWNEKPCPEANAIRYSVRVREGSYWKKVVFDASDDKPLYGAYYSDTACTQFDGPYSSFHKNNQVMTKGRYLANKKIGYWKSYSDNGKLVDSAFYKDGFIYGIALKWYDNGAIEDSLFFEDGGKGLCTGYWSDGKAKESGTFAAGKKSGNWVYYQKNGMKCQEVNYLADSALSYICYDNNGGVQSKDCYYEKEAEFKGGERAWKKYLGQKLSSAVLPKAYYDGKMFGTVQVQFVIDITGKVTDVKVVTPSHPGLDEVAMSIIEQSPRWEPAVQYNRLVRAYRKQPITFTKATEQ